VAALFDVGGTLVRLDFEWMAESMTALGHPVSAEGLRLAEAEGRRRFDASSRASVQPYFEGMLDAAGVPASLWARIGAAWEQRQRAAGLWRRPMEGAREALQELRASGLRLAAVSNSDGRAEEHVRECGMGHLVEFVVDSGLVGVEKPDARIFRLALERLGVAAEQAVCVGDLLSVDRDGARAAGLHFVLVDGTGRYGSEERCVRDMARLPELLATSFQLPRSRGQLQSEV
jgi:putative hydrolase of the HAD superfamily